MRIDVFFADRVGIAQEILARLAGRALDVSAVEVEPPHIFIEAPALQLAQFAALREDLLSVPGVLRVDELQMLPGARRRLYLEALLASQSDPVLAVDGDGVVVLADVETIRARARDKYVGKTILRQVHGADLLVLTKTDLVSEEETAAVGDWLRSIVPEARIVVANHGELPLAVVLGIGDTESAWNHAPDPGDSEDHHLDYDMMSLRLDQLIDGSAFRAAIAALPDGVLRAKGIVWLTDDPNRQTIFQLVGKRWSLKSGGAWDGRQPGTELVFIGLPGSIDCALLAKTFSVSQTEGAVLCHRGPG